MPFHQSRQFIGISQLLMRLGLFSAPPDSRQPQVPVTYRTAELPAGITGIACEKCSQISSAVMVFTASNVMPPDECCGCRNTHPIPGRRIYKV
ncbi:hypothetical protein KCP76_22655 [Salmonella enterica subsp. enterica serovar Weltevreden]|nr:hypothetical protein KCP76_22655 [Salmonella enterica subsp. enterica serovar Weltevreden]